MFSPFESQLLDSNWKCLLIVFKEDADKIPNRLGLKRFFQPSSFCDFLLNSCFCLASLKQRNIQKHCSFTCGVRPESLLGTALGTFSTSSSNSRCASAIFSSLIAWQSEYDKLHLHINVQSKVWRNWKGISSTKINYIYIESRIETSCLSPTLIFGWFFHVFPIMTSFFPCFLGATCKSSRALWMASSLEVSESSLATRSLKGR